MRKFLFLILFSFLILGGCSENAEDVSQPETDQEVAETVADKEKEQKAETSKKKEADEKSNEKKNEGAEKKEPSTAKDQEFNGNRIPVELVYVIDGDTIKVRYTDPDTGVSSEETLRYLLLDTPETKKPNSCVQPFGKEAASRNEQLLQSGKITIEFDGPERDKYGRLLAHVFVDGVSVQETLLEEGLGRIAYVYDPPYKYMEQYKQAEQRAKNNGKKIWSRSGYVTDSGFNGCEDGGSTAKKNNTSGTDGSTLSSNTGTGSGSNTGSNTGTTQHFQNCTELRKVYPKGVPAGHPAYQPKMDRDKDGWACER